VLDHEELHRIRDINSVKNADELLAINSIDFPDPSTLNLSTGITQTMLEKMLIITSKKRPLTLLTRTKRKTLYEGSKKSSTAALNDCWGSI
jgi:hypothetical protein